MFVPKHLRKTLMSGVIGFAVLFPAASHAQMMELAGPLIKWSAGKVMGGVLGSAAGMGFESVFDTDQPLSGATPAQVEEIMQRVLREQLTQQTKELETFIVKNNFTDIKEKRGKLEEQLRNYNFISTGYQDRLVAITTIRNTIDDIMGSIKATLEDKERKSKVPQLFFELYSMHNALIPLRVAAWAEAVLTSNMLYEQLYKSGQKTSRTKSDGIELVSVAHNALEDSRDFWEHDYPGHLNESGAVDVPTDKCISAHPGTLIKSLTGEDLAGGRVDSPMGPGNLHNLLSDLQMMNNSLAHTMDKMRLPRQMGLAHYSKVSPGNQFRVVAICYDDLAMRYSRAFDIGFTKAVINGTIYKWFSPVYTNLSVLKDHNGLNSSYGWIPKGADFDLNHPNGRTILLLVDPCAEWKAGVSVSVANKDPNTLIAECEKAGIAVANIASFTSVNYWKPVRNHIVEKTGVFVAPTTDNSSGGIAHSVDLTDVASKDRQMTLNDLQVKVVSNAYDKRFGSNNEKDVVKNTHAALLAIIDEYMKTRAQRGENIDTRVTKMRQNALSNYQYMHCPEKHKYKTRKGGLLAHLAPHIPASKYEELFGHAELYCQN
jgi:hypothetical protein